MAIVQAFSRSLRKCFSVETLWFEWLHSSADITLYRWLREPVVGQKSMLANTLVIDLSNSEDVIWQGISKSNRYEIRRAKQDEVDIQRPHDTKGSLDSFFQDYEKLRRRKGLGQINLSTLSALADRDLIKISRISVGMSSLVGWHIYIADGQQARLLYSVAETSQDLESAVRARAGRINRLHHWEDILYFKAQGFNIYDFGGFYEGPNDEAKLKINSFKSSFGGHREVRYNAIVANTLAGRLALAAYNLLSRVFRS